jgi:predicted Zn-dependent peptidase
MHSETEISPIDGLDKEQFEKLREQIIEYIQMYRTDGEPIGAYKIMKLFEPFITKSTQHE